MKKRILSLVLVLTFCFAFGSAAFAQSNEFILDFENVVSDKEPLELKAQEIFDAYGVAVIYIRSSDLEGMTGAEYSQHMYSQHVPFEDAVVLIDCAEASSYYMHYAGRAESIFQSADGNLMMTAFDEAGTFDDGVRDYLNLAESILLQRSSATRELVLLEDNAAVQSVQEEQPLLSLTDTQPEIQEQVPGQIPGERQLPLVVDTAGVVAPELIQALNSKAEAISEKYKCEVAALFVKTTNGHDPLAYADDFYDYNGYGYGSGDDGIIFMVAVDDRSFAISTYGSAGYTFTDYGQYYMDERYLPYLRNGDWAGAADVYFDTCAELLEYELKNGVAFDYVEEEYQPDYLFFVLMSLVIGFVLAFIPVSVMKRKMLNVQKQTDASDYVRKGSFALRRKHDRYITSQVTRTPIPKETNNNRGGGVPGGSSFHVSSSGRSHGGHSGRF